MFENGVITKRVLIMAFERILSLIMAEFQFSRIKAVRNAALSASPSPCMGAVGGTPRPQRCPLKCPLRAGPLLSPSRSSVSLFITLNTVLWVHE